MTAQELFDNKSYTKIYCFEIILIVCLCICVLSGCEKRMNSIDVSAAVMENKASSDSQLENGDDSYFTATEEELVKIPSFEGKTIGEALDFLEENKLKYTVVEEYVSNVDKFIVISQEPKEGSMVMPQSEVKLIISSEQKTSSASKVESKKENKAESKTEEKNQNSVPVNDNMTEVPDIVGLNVNSATNALTAAGLYYTGNYEFNSSVPNGQVISQSPASGASVKKGSYVTFIISNGPQPEPQIIINEVVENDTTNQSNNNTQTQPQAPTPSPTYDNGPNYVGTWVGFRPVIVIDPLGGNDYHVVVNCSSSARDGGMWDIYATYNSETDRLEYSNGEMYYYETVNGENIYSFERGGYSGYFKWSSDSELRWIDDESGVSSSDVFHKY